VIAHYAVFRVFDDQVETFFGVGAVADDIAQTVNRLDASLLDILEHNRKGF